jgi:hypothetical protein
MSMSCEHIRKQWVKRAGSSISLLFLVFTLASCYPAPNHVASRPVPAATGGSSRTSLTQVYFYPIKGQTTEQQSRDHFECYNWAMQQTGFDPSQSSIPPERRVKVVPMPPPGHDTAVLAITGAVLGALIAGPRHAAVGALIGGGSGAAAGAVSDVTRQQQSQQLEEAYNGRDRALDTRYDEKARDFRRAMGACLEGRGYSVK